MDVAGSTGTSSTGTSSTGSGLRHLVLFYRDLDDYALAIADFLQAGAGAGEPTLVAVPGVRHDRLRHAIEQRAVPALTLAGMPAAHPSAAHPSAAHPSAAHPSAAHPSAPHPSAPRSSAPHPSAVLAGPAPPTLFVDMSELGRNPGRIIPAIQSFIDDADGRPIRFVGEPVWPGRSAAEICEATRHEALINLAFATTNATILCPYDTASLPRAVIADTRRTHPMVISQGQATLSPTFAGPDSLRTGCNDPLAAWPADAKVEPYAHDLRAVRALIADAAKDAGLPQPRAVDFVLAASEVAANTLRHTQAGGTISVWHANGELICQLADTGHITDPLAGRRSPDQDHPGGQGLWLVNQVCDLVELRSGPAGTVVRLHMRLDR